MGYPHPFHHPPDIYDAHSKLSTTAPQVTHDGVNMPEAIADIEREMILQAMQIGNSVKAQAAKLLHINRTTLVEKIKRLKIEF